MTALGPLRTFEGLCNVQGIIDITLPPSVAALCKSCETICEKECCGISAFSFSPFNVIYHLTKVDACIMDSDVAEIRSGLAELLTNLRGAVRRVEKVVISEFNAIMTAEQMIALVGEIDSALSEGCAIYASQEDRVDERYQNFLRIIETPK
ncbi:DUF6331 family protein [Rhizobium sp. S163]|uniref:DUF6331 family protein n=1 Tax=Rhizobium sp. S163 TaxID=3055039 RepID=UPI0025A934D6|nr:DUF6331 family protein [Rhizobium sp. S163]MDM9647769.1 DUF6331 family protein [Rhizobium sp. S163]